jgi:hypothetical protein
MRLLQLFPLTVALALLPPVCRSEDRFPKWEVAPIGLSGSWERSQNVVVGDVDGVVSVGSQRISNAPWPVASDVTEIYWCQGDFHGTSVIKSGLPSSGKKFLWAAIRPGCGFEYFRYGYQEAEPPVTRVWFLREEGEYLRPAVDGGGVYFVSLHGKWSDPPKGEGPRMLALLMLNPAALGVTASVYSVVFQTPVSLARVILGEKETADRLKSLAAGTSDADLRDSVCAYLSSQFSYSCR